MRGVWMMLTKIKSFLVISICLLLILTFSSPSKAQEGIPKIRVALDKGIVSTSFRVTDGNYILIDKATGLTIDTPLVNEKWSLTLNGTNIFVTKEDQPVGAFVGPVVLESVQDGLNVFSYNNVRYRDNLSVEIFSNSLLVVNNPDLEKYLYGVVGKEMGYAAPYESLKTQAVVSRSFALSSKGSSLKYDVTNTTTSQVFGGYSAELEKGADQVKKAVDETAGEVIYYYDEAQRVNRLVKAYFHANAGGYTEDSENVWNESLPYLRAVPSPYDEKASEYAYKWSKAFDSVTLQQQIDSWNSIARSRNQSYNIIDVGDILGIYAFATKADGITPTESKRVTRLDIVGSKSTKSFFKDAIRSVFGLKSTKFTINADSSIYIMGVDGNPQASTSDGLYTASASEVTTLSKAEGEMLHIIGRDEVATQEQGFTTLTFDGYGYGHGLGLSQWGARGMANAGNNYKEIIEHYYNQDKNDGRLTISKNY